MKDSESAEFIGVIPKALAAGHYWPQISSLIERAIPYGRGEYDIDDILDGVTSGRIFIAAVVGKNADVQFAAACTPIQFPKKSVLFVLYGAGHGASRAKDALVEACRRLECDWIETRCRESVARLYRRHGFTVGYCVPILEV